MKPSLLRARKKRRLERAARRRRCIRIDVRIVDRLTGALRPLSDSLAALALESGEAAQAARRLLVGMAESGVLDRVEETLAARDEFAAAGWLRDVIEADDRSSGVSDAR